jgi:hypothetical protein
MQPGSITPSQSGALVVTAVGFGSNGDTSSINLGFTIAQHVALTGNTYGIGFAYLIQGAAAAINPTWTLSAANLWTAGINSYVAAGGLRHGSLTQLGVGK